VGTTHDYAAVRGLKMDRGRFLTDADNTAAQNYVVLSSDVALALFPEEDPLGKSVKLGTDYYTVIGVVKKANDLKDHVYMPLITSKLRFGERIIDNRAGKREAVEIQLSRLILELRDGADVEATAALVKSTLGPYHPKGDVEVVILKPDQKTR
jgi:putative ABC transport system permease protein